MRYKPEHKEETHRRIVESASKEFRAHGFDGVGIAKLMGDLKLTHGGFYAHFSDKEQLVTEACDVVFDQWLDSMLAAIETGSGFPGIIDFYLSEEHRDQIATGCLLPAVTSEVARSPLTTREAFTRKLGRTFDALSQHISGRTPEEKKQKVQVMFASLVGAVSLARAVSDPELSRSLLDATSKHLLSLLEK